MKTYKIEIFPAIEELVEDKTTCDICGKEMKLTSKVRDSEVYIKTGYSEPEYTDITKTSYDVCIECFKEKLSPFIESFLGAKPTVSNLSY